MVAYPWSIEYDDVGAVYYYNAITMESQWNRPMDEEYMDEQEELQEEEEALQVDIVLGDDWESCADGDGGVYYFSESRQESTWNDPRLVWQSNQPPPITTWDQLLTELDQHDGTDQEVDLDAIKARITNMDEFALGQCFTNAHGDVDMQYLNVKSKIIWDKDHTDMVHTCSHVECMCTVHVVHTYMYMQK